MEYTTLDSYIQTPIVIAHVQCIQLMIEKGVRNMKYRRNFMKGEK